MGVHDGHRDRMKKRFAVHGLDSFDDVNVLELLLFYAIPRRETNTAAHALLERFGSLDAVFEAELPELMKVEGIGENAAALIRLIPQIDRRYHVCRSEKDGRTVSSSAEAGRRIVPLYMYEKQEVVYLLCLDSKRAVISCEELSRGVVNSVDVNVRRIVELALNHNAASIIIAHNHISGFAIPSREDEIITRQIAAALALVHIALADHLIGADGDYISLADTGVVRGY